MPKGARGARDYEKEIEDAARRMKKYPEHRRAARDSEEWMEFIQDVGVKNPDWGFWQDVRDKINPPIIGHGEPIRPPEPPEPPVNIEAVTVHYKSGKTATIYRDLTTGRFTSKR